MLPAQSKEKYEAFFASTESGEFLDPRTTLMLQLAASFVIGCYP